MLHSVDEPNPATPTGPTWTYAYLAPTVRASNELSGVGRIHTSDPELKAGCSAAGVLVLTI